MAKCDLELKKALESAQSGKKLKPSPEEEELGFGMLQVSQELDSEGYDPEKVFSLAKMALRNIMIRAPVGWASAAISALSVLGSSCYKLKIYDESLEYLEWVDTNLNKFDELGDGCDSDEILQCIQTVQFLVPLVKEAMGRLEIETCIVHLRKVLEEESSLLAIVKAYINVCKAYVATLNAHEALPFGLKALGVYMKHFGSDLEMIRESLEQIYPALGQSEKDIGLIEEQTRLSSNLFDVLKPVVSSEKAEGALLAGALMAVAPVYYLQGEFDEVRDLMDTATKTLEMVEIEPFRLANLLGCMAFLHEKMNDNETAIALLRRSLALPNLPEELIEENYTRLFVLINESYMGEQAIQYLEEAVERLKQSLGPKHWLVGYGYHNMGLVATDLHKRLHGLIYLRNAKHILDGSVGPHDDLSLVTSQMISLVYALSERPARAIECQEVVIEGLKELGPSYKVPLDLAVLLLNKIKEATGL